jgi:hypothetical protein
MASRTASSMRSDIARGKARSMAAQPLFQLTQFLKCKTLTKPGQVIVRINTQSIQVDLNSSLPSRRSF